MKPAQRSRAQSMVEFAITIPLFLSLLLMTFEGGRLMFTWVLLSEGTREAARVAVLPSTTTTAAIKQRAMNMVGVAGVVVGDISVSRNGTAVSGTFEKARGDTMVVRIDFTYTVTMAAFLRPELANLPFTSLSIPVQTSMRAEG